MPQKGGAQDDFFMIEANGLACQKLVCDLVSTRLPKAYGFDPVRDIQVLCPTKVGPTGSVELNRRLQEILNPPAKGKAQLGTAESAKILRLGDKVMQTRNNYTKNVFNGDIGFITAVEADHITVYFSEDLSADYEKSELNELQLAYAMSVHKSQGSEYPVVLLPLVPGHHVMLQRNLLYTAVTRAKRQVVLLGSKAALNTAVENDRTRTRYTLLAERLCHKLTE